VTGLLEADTSAAFDASQRDGSEPRGRWARAAAELRLARRAVVRAGGGSMLVATLVALPMIALGGGLVVWASHTPTLAQEVTLALGDSQARFEIVNGPDPSLSQVAEDPGNWSVDWDEDAVKPANPELARIADPLDLIPTGTRTLEISTGMVTGETAGGLGNLGAVIGQAWDPSLAGRFEAIAGQPPSNDREAMVSPGALERLGAEIGDTLVLTEPSGTFTIAGVMKSADRPSSYQEVFLPRTAGTGSAIESSLWFTPDWQPEAADLSTFNREGVVVAARDLMLQRTGAAYVDPAAAWGIAAGVAVAMTFCAYLVMLLAGAAFSVSARRQQHSLAVAASVGAQRSTIFRIVLLQGSVLGLLGGIGGAAIGVAAAFLTLVLLDDGNVRSFWGFHVPWWGIVGITAFAVVVGTLAALVPARNATRGDVLHALRGARRPVSVRADRPLWGSLLILVGLGVTLASGLALAGLDPSDFNHPMRMIGVVGIVAGPILFQVGVIVAGHWVLSLIARAGSWLGLPGRIAVRDAAANPGRVVPAFAAIAACVFIASFALSAVAIYTASATRYYWWQAPEGSLRIDIWASQEVAAETEQLALDAAALADPDHIAVLRGEPTTWTAEDATLEAEMPLFRAELHDYEPCVGEEWSSPPCMSEWDAKLGGDRELTVVEPDQVATAIGTSVPEAAMEVYRDGGVIVLGELSYPGDLINDGHVAINEWSGDARSPDVYNTANDGDLPDPLNTWSLPALRIDPLKALPYSILMAPDTAADLGLETVARAVIGGFSEPPTQREIDQVALSVSQPWTEDRGLTYRVETGPPSAEVWLLLILGGAGALILGAAGVTLGLARVERRPDDATLTAVGASRFVRRGIAFWQGAVIVGVGTLTGTFAGLIPMWGITLSIDALDFADTPWLWLAGLAIGLPITIAVVNWLVPPRNPDLTRRTTIA
jgi:putative ABC transport system permease protein